MNEEPVTAEMGIAAALILGSVAMLLRAREAPVRSHLEEPVSSGASWADTPASTTDGHLTALASPWNARLVTLDEGIPGSETIPG